MINVSGLSQLSWLWLLFLLPLWSGCLLLCGRLQAVKIGCLLSHLGHLRLHGQVGPLSYLRSSLWKATQYFSGICLSSSVFDVGYWVMVGCAGRALTEWGLSKSWFWHWGEFCGEFCVGLRLLSGSFINFSSWSSTAHELRMCSWSLLKCMS